MKDKGGIRNAMAIKNEFVVLCFLTQSDDEEEELLLLVFRVSSCDGGAVLMAGGPVFPRCTPGRR